MVNLWRHTHIYTTYFPCKICIHVYDHAFWRINCLINDLSISDSILKLCMLFSRFFVVASLFKSRTHVFISCNVQQRTDNMMAKIQRSTKYTHTTKDRVTQTPLKTGGELVCSRGVSSSCSTSGTHRVNLITNSVISHEWGQDREELQRMEHIRSHLWHRYSITFNQVIAVTVKHSKWWLQLNQ